MQVGATRRGWGGVCLVLWAGIAVVAEPVSTVLVTDFQAPSTATWAWARRGLPELAVEALNERGIVTVDRDLLSVINTEHDNSTGKEVAQGGLQMSQWLGATFLLQGSIETVKVDRVRLSGTLTRVETAEQIGVGSVEGNYKKELHALMGRWVAVLTKNVWHGIQAAVPEKVNPVKPEALMFFQQGVDACAAGKPALAVGFFLSAHAMDTRLQAAKQWEAHAYELGGLPRYAASVREHAATSNAASPSSVADTIAPTQTVQRVVSVLTPVWLGESKAAAVAMPTMPALRLSQETAVLACKGVQLYRPESLSEAVAETDRQLSLQFNPHGVSRYARWLVSDVVLYSTVTPLAKGKVGLEVGLMNALTAQRIKQVKRDVVPTQLSATLATLARECLDGWKPLAATRNTGASAFSVARRQLSDEDVERLPDFKKIAIALDARMRGEAKVFHCQMLADYYAYKGLKELAALELEEVLLLAEVRKPEMDGILTSAYWWVNGFPCHSTLSRDLGSRGWGTNFYQNAALDPDAAAITRARFATIRSRLLKNYPASLGTFAVYFVEAAAAYTNKQWPLCVTNAAAAWQCLETREQTGYAGHTAFLGMYSHKKDKANIHISCLFLRGFAHHNLGELEQARRCYDQIQTIIDQAKLGGDARPQSPILCFEEAPVLVGLAQTCSEFTFNSYIAAEREALKKGELDIKQRLNVLAEGDVLSESIQKLSSCDSDSPEENLRWLYDIIRVWAQLPTESHATCTLADKTRLYVKKIKSLPAEQRLAVLNELTLAYFRVTGIDPNRLKEFRSIYLVGPRIQYVTRLYDDAGLGLNVFVWLDRLLEQPVDPFFGSELIGGYVELFAKFSDLSVNGAQPSGLTTSSQAPALAISENPQVQLINSFFARHKDIPRVHVAHAKYWQTLGGLAAVNRNYQAWYQCCTNALAIDPVCAVSDHADIYSARLALASGVPDVLLEAIRLRESLGPSPRPIHFVVWYAAGFLCINEKDYDQALTAFRLFRETYNEADFFVDNARLSATQSDESVLWSLEYGEGLALAATGQAAEAAKRFRHLSQRFGTRPVYLWESSGSDDKGHQVGKPLGLLASEALEKLHLDEQDGSVRPEKPQEEVKQ